MGLTACVLLIACLCLAGMWGVFGLDRAIALSDRYPRTIGLLLIVYAVFGCILIGSIQGLLNIYIHRLTGWIPHTEFLNDF